VGKQLLQLSSLLIITYLLCGNISANATEAATNQTPQTIVSGYEFGY